MHTESGSDMMDYFPHYHELPEPDTQPRGYSSNKLMDEKPFKRQLEESYDEQARQEVLNEDIIGPLLKQMEQRNQEWREEQKRKRSQTMEALSGEAAKELEKIGGYLIPRPLDMGQANSYALSALADVSEWVAQQHPQQQYIYVSLAKGDTFPAQALDFSPLPGQGPSPSQKVYQQVIRPESRPRGRRLKYPPLTNGSANITTSSPALYGLPAPVPLSAAPDHAYQGAPSFPPQGQRIVSSGPGQVIAPAPPRAAQPTSRPNVNIFRHNTRFGPPPPPPPPSTPTHTRQNSYTLTSPQTNGSASVPQPPQTFVFQPPQQPFQHQAAPVQPSTPQYAPPSTPDQAPAVAPDTPAANIGPSEDGSPGAPVSVGGQQTKIPITFVNQTIASRNAAAASQGGAGGKGTDQGNGKRVLLPKV